MTASAPLAAFFSGLRFPPPASQEAGLENRVSGKSAATTDSPSASPALTFPDVLGGLVETNQPAATPKGATPKEDAASNAANPATAGRSTPGAATPGFVRNSQLGQSQTLAAALPALPAVAATTVTPPVKAARAEKPAAATSTAPETTAEDLAHLSAPESFWSQPANPPAATALLNGLSTAPGSPAAVLEGSAPARTQAAALAAQGRPAKGSPLPNGSGLTAGTAPLGEDAPALPKPLATLPSPNDPGNPPPQAEWPASTDGAVRNRWMPPAGREPGLAAWPAARRNSASQSQPSSEALPAPTANSALATARGSQPFSVASPALPALADTAAASEAVRLPPPTATSRAPQGPSPKRAPDPPATPRVSRTSSSAAAALPALADTAAASEAVRLPPPTGTSRAPERPSSKPQLDPAVPTPATAGAAGTLGLASPALPALAGIAAASEAVRPPPTTTARAPERLSSKLAPDPAVLTPAIPQPAADASLPAAPANPARVPATTTESTRQSAPAATQPPLPGGATGFAAYGDLSEPALQPVGGKTAELAFGARLVPTAAPVGAPAAEPPDPRAGSVTAPAHPRAAAPLDGATREPASEVDAVPPDPAGGQTGDAADESSSLPASLEKGDGAAERFRKAETPVPAPGEASAASAARLSPDAVYAPAGGSTSAASQPAHAAAAEPRAAAAPEPNADAEPARPTAAARNIQFDVSGGDQRVEVRLTERGGEVQVDVRTPDAHLASALREDLPALSSRLAESGFRAETWHPASPAASSGPEWHKLAEPSAGGTPQDSNGRSRQNGGQPQDESQPRQPKTSAPQPDLKNPGKDFAWLMSSLR